MSLPDFHAVAAAAQRLQGQALRTPVLRSEQLDARCGRQLFIKPECLQRTGSFKFRGAFNRLSQLSPAEREQGVVAWSSGNHAQGVALAAKLLGTRARIVMPADAPRVKADNTRALGAEVIPYDRHSEDREAIARALVARDGGVLVPSYDDPDIVAGQGTVGLELLQDAGPLDAMLVCCSGGGLVAGCALAAEGLAVPTRIFAVEPQDFNDHQRSLDSGQREHIKPGGTSICDALLAPTPGELTFAINQRLLSGGLSVTDDEVRSAMALAFAALRLVVEPGGAVALAAVLAGRLPEEYQRVGVVLSGGNVDADLFAAVLTASEHSQ